jgi:hypothetical protein
LGCSSIRKNEHFLFEVQNCSHFEISKEKFNFPFEDSTEFQEISKIMTKIEIISNIDVQILNQYERGTVDYDVGSFVLTRKIHISEMIYFYSLKKNEEMKGYCQDLKHLNRALMMTFHESPKFSF